MFLRRGDVLIAAQRSWSHLGVSSKVMVTLRGQLKIPVKSVSSTGKEVYYINFCKEGLFCTG